jgi:hypothetical protein
VLPDLAVEEPAVGVDELSFHADVSRRQGRN